MRIKILVAGATGNLGLRICRELMKRNSEVIDIVRNSVDPVKTNLLKNMGVDVRELNFDSIDDIAGVCIDVTCVISSLEGLADVVIDLQKKVLDGYQVKTATLI